MATREAQQFPRARVEGLVVQELTDEVLVYDRKSHHAHCLNRTAALVWRQCDGRTSIKQMRLRLAGELKAPVGEEALSSALEQLGKARLLLETKADPGRERVMSRRELAREMGLATALTVPLVTTILVPAALAAASCASLSCAGANPCLATPGCTCSSGNCVPV